MAFTAESGRKLGEEVTALITWHYLYILHT